MWNRRAIAKLANVDLLGDQRGPILAFDLDRDFARRLLRAVLALLDRQDLLARAHAAADLHLIGEAHFVGAVIDAAADARREAMLALLAVERKSEPAAADAAAGLAGVSKVLVADAPHYADQSPENLAALVVANAASHTHLLAAATTDPWRLGLIAALEAGAQVVLGLWLIAVAIAVRRASPDEP